MGRKANGIRFVVLARLKTGVAVLATIFVRKDERASVRAGPGAPSLSAHSHVAAVIKDRNEREEQHAGPERARPFRVAVGGRDKLSKAQEVCRR